MAKLAIVREFWLFFRTRKKMWLAPLIVLLLVLGTVIFFAESSVIAPFIYTLF
jgi:hypothetical protein